MPILDVEKRKKERRCENEKKRTIEISNSIVGEYLRLSRERPGFESPLESIIARREKRMKSMINVNFYSKAKESKEGRRVMKQRKRKRKKENRRERKNRKRLLVE